MRRRIIFPLVLICFLAGAGQVAAVDRQATGDEACAAAVAGLIENGAWALLKNGRIVCPYNIDQELVPASTIKIATALVALQVLGPDYRFATRFYHDQDKNLYIRGSGDPFLVSEEASLIMHRLQALGVELINNIYIDDSAFELSGAAAGAGKSDNPYDAPNSALSVNFNTVYITVNADGSVKSAEPQTPTLPLMAVLGRGRAPGTYRLNISGSAAGREIIALHAGELFRALQLANDIPGRGVISRARVPPDLEPVYVHRSGRDLEGMIRSMLFYSSNFIANQLFLACGAEQAGYPAGWEKSRSMFKDYLSAGLGLDEEAASLVEGSGLSRRNLVTARAMLAILEAFKPYAHLLPPGGREGLVKSGTLSGVYAYAGYLRSGPAVNSFVIILNQRQNNRDRLLEMLETVNRESN